MSDVVEYDPENLLAGMESQVDDSGTWHFGLTATFKDSKQQLSSLIIPDLGNFSGTSAVMITKPITIELEKIAKAIDNCPSQVTTMLTGKALVLRAFYYSSTGPCLMDIEVTADPSQLGGLLAGIIPDKVAEIFTITGFSIRAFKSDSKGLEKLKDYVASLIGAAKKKEKAAAPAADSAAAPAAGPDKKK